MWFLLALIGGGYLAYRHFHHDHLLPVSHGPGKLTLSAGEIHAYGSKLLFALSFIPSGQTTKAAVDFLKSPSFTILDRNAIAHSAIEQGADKASVDKTLLSTELE